MSKIVARMAKMKAENLQGIQRHNQREIDNHSNKDIDINKSVLNYDLINLEPINYREKITEIIDSQKVSNRAVRKDAVLVDEWIITSDTHFFADKNESRAFFEDALAYFSERCGSQNVVYATVHLDETTPHMHLGVVPMIEGKLSSKQMFDRKALKDIQEELPLFLQKNGHDIERGIKGSEQKHLTVEEFKANKQEVTRMENKIDLLKSEVALLDSQKDVLNNSSYELWHDEWLETKKEFPDFSMNYPVPVLEDTKVEMPVTQETPRLYHMDFSEVFQLFKEKIQQLKSYIAEKLKNLALREELVERCENALERKENALEAKLEGLNNDTQVKLKENENLDRLLEQKLTFIDSIKNSFKLAEAMPDYVKPSKLNKDMLVIPKEKWLEKQLSGEVLKSISRLQGSLDYATKRIEKNVVHDKETYDKYVENRDLKREHDSLKRNYNSFWNGFADLINNKIISDNVAKQLDLPKDFQREFKLINEQASKNNDIRRDYGPRL